jgi:hypothetical protein
VTGNFEIGESFLNSYFLLLQAQMMIRELSFIILIACHSTLGLRLLSTTRVGSLHTIKKWFPIRATTANNDAVVNVDVAVIGGGPAGTIISWLLQEREKCKVAIIDPSGDSDRTWYPNYGEWREEWAALSGRLQLPELLTCTTTEWEKTDSFFGGSYGVPFDERVTLDRAYVRVDRVKLQKLIKDKYRQAGGWWQNTHNKAFFLQHSNQYI